MKLPVEVIIRAAGHQTTRVWAKPIKDWDGSDMPLSALAYLQGENPDQVRAGGGLAFVDPEIHRIRDCLINLGKQIIADQALRPTQGEDQ